MGTGGSGVTVASPGHGCDPWTLDHAVAWEQQLTTASAAEPHTALHTAVLGHQGQVPSRCRWWCRCCRSQTMVTEVWKQKVELCLCAAVSLEQGSHAGTRAEGTSATSLLLSQLCVVHSGSLSLQIINVACSGHPHSSWNKCHMPNNSPASGCFAKWSHSYGKISYSVSIRASQKFPLSFRHHLL